MKAGELRALLAKVDQEAEISFATKPGQLLGIKAVTEVIVQNRPVIALWPALMRMVGKEVREETEIDCS